MNNYISGRKEKRALRILYVLAIYIFLQLSWWGYHLVQLNYELCELKSVVLGQSYLHLFKSKIWMVIGEGLVFFILLALGFRYIKRTVSRELELARMEQTFLLSVTHELKTPIASVKLIMETLKTRKLEPEQSAVMINQALQETKRLQSLTENILLATRLDQSTDILTKGTVDLAQLTKAEVNRFVSIHSARINTDIEEDVIIQGDEQMISAMIVNLIENALKYSPAGEVVDVKIAKSQNHAMLEITDRGMGIPDNEKEKVFEKFYRVGTEETRTSKGTGLGLYIVKTISNLHKGKISLRNNVPSGSIFAIQLPLN